MKLTLTELAEVAEVVAAIAIVISLIFVGIQIQENTSAIRSQEIAGIYEQIQARQLIAVSSDFGSVYTKSLYNPKDLTLSEIYRMTSNLSHRLNNFERTYLAYLDGIIREADWERHLSGVPIFLGTKTGRLFWEEFKGDYSENPNFVNEIETALRTSTIIPDDEWLLNLQRNIQNL